MSKLNLTPLIFVIIFLMMVPSYAQSRMTDRELNGLLGQVKSVEEQWKDIKTFPGQNLKSGMFYISLRSYDADGSQTETMYEDNSRVIYTMIDGFKTFKTKEPPSPVAGTVMTIRADDDKEVPIEKNEKITSPDNRFDFKVTYEYDDKGRVIVERQFGNNGKQWYLRTFKYDDSGKVSEEIRNDTVAITKYTFTYNQKKFLIESIEDRDIKGRGIDSTRKLLYSNYVIDRDGNWTSREVHTFYSSRGMPEYKLPPEKWDVIRAEFRTFTYHK